MARVVVWGAHERRYEVYVVEDGETINEYMGGNSPWESQTTLPEGHPAALPLSKMREYAESTARETAEEYDADYDGEDPDITNELAELYKAIKEGRL